MISFIKNMISFFFFIALKHAIFLLLYINILMINYTWIEDEWVTNCTAILSQMTKSILINPTFMDLGNIFYIEEP